MIDGHACKFEKKIITLCEDVAAIKQRVVALDDRVNGSIDDIHNHIKSGQGWRTTIMVIAFSFVVHLISFSYLYGRTSRIVEENKVNIERLQKNVSTGVRG